MNDWKTSDLIGLGSVTAFILTILYVYGYSIAVNMNLFVYFSVKDYLKLAIQWLTPILSVGLIGLLVNKLVTRVERGATDEELVQCSPYPRFTRAFRRLGDVAPLALLLVAALFNTVLSFFTEVPKGRLYSLWAIVGPMLWIATVNWYMKVPRLVASWSKKWGIFITFSPALVIFAFCYGLYNAESEHGLLENNSGIKVLLRDQSKPLVGETMFSLDEYVLIRQREHRQVIVIPKNEIAVIVHSVAK